ncbi:MAG: nickel pincer cofactor biosynthesis protein LarC [Coriobacteriales bacterium]|jgi:uncharacterized protein (TIGR00299 family) protein|nr:nickel pincer cofactor biosynthesis protein LarC [Coriobacteriales bacterium]
MILHFDFSTGASGDKVLGALLAVAERLGCATFEELERLAGALVPAVRIERLPILQGGIQATGIRVTEDAPKVRHWQGIRETIEKAGAECLLSERACTLALDAFGAIAEAEAAVHGCAVEKVHFHEVGAADSILDICCSSFLFDRLAPEAVFATPLALGFGSFVCSHGEMPVPAFATARLVEGLPVYAGPHEGELTTPTGAALARVFVDAFEPLPRMVLRAVGHGAGSRSIPGTANVVRVLAGQSTEGRFFCAATTDSAPLREHKRTVPLCSPLCSPADDGLLLEGCTLLETNIDHLSAEALAFACEELFGLGALDVWQEPIVMKKGRLAVRLSVLVRAGAAQELAAHVMGVTGSLGVRTSSVERFLVPRTVVAEQTRFGTVRYKTACVATPEGRIRFRRPEYEDVARIAREQQLGFNDLSGELMQPGEAAVVEARAVGEVERAEARATGVARVPEEAEA